MLLQRSQVSRPNLVFSKSNRLLLDDSGKTKQQTCLGLLSRETAASAGVDTHLDNSHHPPVEEADSRHHDYTPRSVSDGKEWYRLALLPDRRHRN